ncbi:MAG: PAS domain-containing sensor histidine kinase [Desulfobacteraceae bacterium]|nr:MAG: PAS domain-containing sensor histidine kinase [Desulfobacteraceae bacterium]
MPVKNTNHNNSANPSEISEETLRGKMEKALRESEERYRDLVENATDLICTHNLKGTVLSVNKAALEATGFSPEEIIGLCIPDLLPEPGQREFDKYINAIRSDGTATGTMKIVTRKGEVRYWEYRNTLRTEGVPEPIVRGVARDVTGEILAKRALKKSEKRYRLLFERNLAGVYRTTMDGRIIDCNEAFARIYGYESREEIIEHAATDLHVSAEARREFIAVLQAKEMLVGFESRGRRKDGSLVWLLENTSLVPGEDGGLKEIEGMLIDITERKRIEEALRESEEQHRLIVENSSDIIFTLDADGKFLFLSSSLLENMGYEISELQSRPFQSIIHPDYIRTCEENIRKNIEKGERTPGFEYLVKDKSGNWRWHTTSGAAVRDTNGSFLYFVGIARDITDRKKMEDELLKADKLESVGILAGGIAHDFNNILTSIAGNISLAIKHVKPGSRAFDLLSSAETASIRARGLTGQLLTFAKGGAPAKETASISSLIKESSLFALRGSKSECKCSIAEDLWPVEADMGQMIQVISNIVINADQAMPDGGIIQVTAENVVLDESRNLPVKPGRYLRISIKDKGIGIVDKHLSKIFDPYFTTKNAGSGLGLATAYSIIKKHNGHISVDSRPGAGTTFNIYLPASDKAVPLKEDKALLTGHGKILWMDDDRMLRNMAEEMLEMLGYEPEFAENGAEAVEMYKKTMESEKPYDAVILDLTIPGGMGGKEAIKKLLELNHQLNAIVCSGYSEDPVMSNYSEYGFKSMMPKPFDLHTLGRALNEVLKAENRI